MDHEKNNSLFVDDLKVHQESHNALKNINEIIVQTSHNIGACYGISKCVEMILKHGKVVHREGFWVLEERMKAMDPDEYKIYSYLRIEQADGI